ncbi:unnamed protein product [Allacma fusca]|uniref:Tyr recombinase domain-containing protein n=1 Tax=Allacma fusca TaxID=39272 RepID=A0A8J2P5G3_9HEXA|nr:unnamed protein product [Allacma fusca]
MVLLLSVAQAAKSFSIYNTELVRLDDKFLPPISRMRSRRSRRSPSLIPIEDFRSKVKLVEEMSKEGFFKLPGSAPAIQVETPERAFPSNFVTTEVLSTVQQPLPSIINQQAASTQSYPVLTCGDLVRATLTRQRINSNTIDIIISSLTPSSLRQYSVYCRYWTNFCLSCNWDPSVVELNQVLGQFLSYLYDLGLRYSSMNTARSFLSLVSSGSTSDGIGSLQGPPNYLSNLEPIESLSLEDITMKTIGLISVATAHRAQTFSLIDVREIVQIENCTKIKIHSPVKTSKPGSTQPVLFLPRFADHPSLCVSRSLSVYLQRTHSFRPQDSNRLFLALSKPHAAVCSQTISRSIKHILKLSGIDITTFSGHSVRHASTSTAARGGLSIDQIRLKAGWSSSSSVFANFYNRPIPQNDNFDQTVFILSSSIFMLLYSSRYCC